MQRSRSPPDRDASRSSTGGRSSSISRRETDQSQAQRHSGQNAGKGRTSSQTMACDACRQKKTRCFFEGSVPVCLQCLVRGTQCVVATRKSKVATFKRAQYVRTLETRLQQTESLLRAAGLLPNDYVNGNDRGDDHQLHDDLDDDDEDYDPAPNDGFDQSPASDKTTPISVNSVQSISREPASASKVCVIKDGSTSEGYYYGSASSFYILSHVDIDFIRENSGEADFPNAMLSQPCWNFQSGDWRPDVFHDLFTCKVFKALPPRSEVFSLLKIYFQTINRIFPIFHEESFMRMVEWQYTQQTLTDVGRWAAINVLLAFSYRYRLSRGPRPEEDIERSWMYFKNAASVYMQLALRRNNLLGIQALVAMAFFLRANGRLPLALPLVTAVIQSCHALGLHRRHLRPDLSPVEHETRRRVFWCALWIDQCISIHSGLSPVQNLDDLDLDLPNADSEDGSETDWSTPFFRISCQHTLIRFKIYQELYSSRALGKPLTDLQRAVDELNMELESWRRENPYLRSKSSVKTFLDTEQELKIVSICSQWLAYNNSLILINRVPLIHEVVLRKGPLTTLNDFSSFSSNAQKGNWTCIQAARDSLKILQGLPSREMGCSCSFLEYTFVATLIVFGNIIREPKNPYTEENMKLLNTGVTYFNTLVPHDGQHRPVRFMASMSSILEVTAKKIVDKASKESKLADRVPSNGTKPSELLGYTSNVQVPDIEGLPSVPSSGYFVPGSPTGQNKTNTFNSGPMNLDRIPLVSAPPQVGEQLNAPSQHRWTLPITDSSMSPDPSMAYLWDLPFMPEWQMFNPIPEMMNPSSVPQNGQNVSNTAFSNMENNEWLQDLWEGHG